MPLPTGPFARAHHVGSFIRPDNLIKAREAAAQKKMSDAELQRIQEAAIRDVVKMQEDLGLKVVTDGEYNRGSWQRDFLLEFDNVALVPSKIAVKFHTTEGARENAPPSLQVQGKIAHSHPIFVDDFKFLKSTTKATPKVTFPSPSTLHFRGGRDAVDKKAYPDINGFYKDVAKVYREEIADLAARGCRYLQLDDTNLAYLCDPKIREAAKGRGLDPDHLPRDYAKLINAAIAKKPANMTICTHLCRGNFKSAWVAEGGYEPVAEVLFNELNVDGYFLEYDDERSGDFKPLRYLPKGKTMVLGLVTTKLDAVESKDAIKRRIDEAAKYAPVEQFCLSPQCGFSSTVHGNEIHREAQANKLRLIVDIAKDVWG
jgi:5-methyltetrahydropteroyltriglutamate--homocysteine methyltransferase